MVAKMDQLVLCTVLSPGHDQKHAESAEHEKMTQKKVIGFDFGEIYLRPKGTYDSGSSGPLAICA